MFHNKVSLYFFLILISPFLPAQQVMTGKALYEQSCMVCHGEDGSGGMPGVADLSGASGPLSRTDKQLVKSIRKGVQREGTAMVMPPSGGNPQLTDQDIRNIIVYMRKAF